MKRGGPLLLILDGAIFEFIFEGATSFFEERDEENFEAAKSYDKE